MTSFRRQIKSSRSAPPACNGPHQRYQQIAAAARRGDASGLEDDLRINCPAGVRQPTRW